MCSDFFALGMALFLGYPFVFGAIEVWWTDHLALQKLQHSSRRSFDDMES